VSETIFDGAIFDEAIFDVTRDEQSFTYEDSGVGQLLVVRMPGPYLIGNAIRPARG